MPSPQRSLGHSLFKQKFSQKFLCFFVLFCFFVFCVFYFIKISKFALPGVMLIYERTSKDRKKERKKEPDHRILRSSGSSLLPQTASSLVSFPGQFLCGTLFQLLQLRHLLWYPSKRGYPPSHSKFKVRAQWLSSLLRWGRMGPGTSKEGSLVSAW